MSRPGRALAKPAQSRCHSFGRLLRLLAVRRARAANSKTSFCALDHVAALPRLLSNDEAEALADCTACSSCLVSVLCVSSEWWRCVRGVLGTGSSRSPRRSGIRVAPKSVQECHRVPQPHRTRNRTAHTHAPQSHTALCRAAHRCSFVFFDRIPTSIYKRLKKRCDLRLALGRPRRTITGHFIHIVVCVCAMCFSLACRRQRRRPSLAVSHCMTGARAFFGDFTWKERCSSARRNPECAGDFGFSTYKPRGIL